MNTISGPESLRLQPIRLAALVAPNSTVKLTYPVQRDATLTSLRIRIYAGAGLQLQITPYVINAREQRRNLIQAPLGGKSFIDGDDDTFLFPLSEPVDADAADIVVVAATNLDSVNSYDFAVDLSVDFSNGQYPGVNGRG